MSDSASKSDAEVKNEEPKEEKKEAKKKRPASSRETVDEDIPLVREPRQRKQTAFFQTEISSSNDRPVIIEKGPGTELGEIENVKRRLDSTKVKEPFLKLLHRVLFPGSHPREATVKKNIAKFSGFATKLSEKDREKLEEKLEQNELKQLKNIADLLDIEHSGKKADVVTRIVDFLHKPVSSGKEFRAKKKTSSSSSSSKSAKKDGSSRGPSAYILFTQEYRQKIKDKHPDATFAELGKLLGQKWGSLSEAEKDKYKEMAGGEPSKKKQKSSKPAKKRSHDDDEEEEEEEESEEEEKKPAKKKQKAPAKKESKEKEAKEDKPGVKATEEQKTQMQAKVRELLKDQDLYKYTMGLLKKDLAKDFPVDVITGEKEWLKNLLKEEISKAKKSE